MMPFGMEVGLSPGDFVFDVEQRAPPMFGRATITLGIGPHSSFAYICGRYCKVFRGITVFGHI